MNHDLYTATDPDPCLAIMRLAGDLEAIEAAVAEGACVTCATQAVQDSSRAARSPSPAAREANDPAGSASASAGEGPADPAGSTDGGAA